MSVEIAGMMARHPNAVRQFVAKKMRRAAVLDPFRADAYCRIADEVEVGNMCPVAALAVTKKQRLGGGL